MQISFFRLIFHSVVKQLGSNLVPFKEYHQNHKHYHHNCISAVAVSFLSQPLDVAKRTALEVLVLHRVHLSNLLGFLYALT
jgi:hypothetical protein